MVMTYAVEGKLLLDTEGFDKKLLESAKKLEKFNTIVHSVGNVKADGFSTIMTDFKRMFESLDEMNEESRQVKKGLDALFEGKSTKDPFKIKEETNRLKELRKEYERVANEINKATKQAKEFQESLRNATKTRKNPKGVSTTKLVTQEEIQKERELLKKSENAYKEYTDIRVEAAQKSLSIEEVALSKEEELAKRRIAMIRELHRIEYSTGETGYDIVSDKWANIEKEYEYQSQKNRVRGAKYIDPLQRMYNQNKVIRGYYEKYGSDFFEYLDYKLNDVDNKVFKHLENIAKKSKTLMSEVIESINAPRLIEEMFFDKSIDNFNSKTISKSMGQLFFKNFYPNYVYGALKGTANFAGDELYLGEELAKIYGLKENEYFRMEDVQSGIVAMDNFLQVLHEVGRDIPYTVEQIEYLGRAIGVIATYDHKGNYIPPKTYVNDLATEYEKASEGVKLYVDGVEVAIGKEKELNDVKKKLSIFDSNYALRETAQVKNIEEEVVVQKESLDIEKTRLATIEEESEAMLKLIEMVRWANTQFIGGYGGNSNIGLSIIDNIQIDQTLERSNEEILKNIKYIDESMHQYGADLVEYTKYILGEIDSDVFKAIEDLEGILNGKGSRLKNRVYEGVESIERKFEELKLISNAFRTYNMSINDTLKSGLSYVGLEKEITFLENVLKRGMSIKTAKEKSLELFNDFPSTSSNLSLFDDLTAAQNRLKSSVAPTGKVMEVFSFVLERLAESFEITAGDAEYLAEKLGLLTKSSEPINYIRNVGDVALATSEDLKKLVDLKISTEGATRIREETEAFEKEKQVVLELLTLIRNLNSRRLFVGENTFQSMDLYTEEVVANNRKYANESEWTERVDKLMKGELKQIYERYGESYKKLVNDVFYSPNESIAKSLTELVQKTKISEQEVEYRMDRLDKKGRSLREVLSTVGTSFETGLGTYVKALKEMVENPSISPTGFFDEKNFQFEKDVIKDYSLEKILKEQEFISTYARDSWKMVDFYEGEHTYDHPALKIWSELLTELSKEFDMTTADVEKLGRELGLISNNVGFKNYISSTTEEAINFERTLNELIESQLKLKEVTTSEVTSSEQNVQAINKESEAYEKERKRIVELVQMIREANMIRLEGSGDGKGLVNPIKDNLFFMDESDLVEKYGDDLIEYESYVRGEIESDLFASLEKIANKFKITFDELAIKWKEIVNIFNGEELFDEGWEDVSEMSEAIQKLLKNIKLLEGEYINPVEYWGNYMGVFKGLVGSDINKKIKKPKQTRPFLDAILGSIGDGYNISQADAEFLATELGLLGNRRKPKYFSKGSSDELNEFNKAIDELTTSQLELQNTTKGNIKTIDEEVQSYRIEEKELEKIISLARALNNRGMFEGVVNDNGRSAWLNYSYKLNGEVEDYEIKNTAKSISTNMKSYSPEEVTKYLTEIFQQSGENISKAVNEFVNKFRQMSSSELEYKFNNIKGVSGKTIKELLESPQAYNYISTINELKGIKSLGAFEKIRNKHGISTAIGHTMNLKKLMGVENIYKLGDDSYQIKVFAAAIDELSKHIELTAADVEKLGRDLDVFSTKEAPINYIDEMSNKFASYNEDLNKLKEGTASLNDIPTQTPSNPIVENVIKPTEEAIERLGKMQKKIKEVTKTPVGETTQTTLDSFVEGLSEVENKVKEVPQIVEESVAEPIKKTFKLIPETVKQILQESVGELRKQGEAVLTEMNTISDKAVDVIIQKSRLATLTLKQDIAGISESARAKEFEKESIQGVINRFAKEEKLIQSQTKEWERYFKEIEEMEAFEEVKQYSKISENISKVMNELERIGRIIVPQETINSFKQLLIVMENLEKVSKINPSISKKTYARMVEENLKMTPSDIGSKGYVNYYGSELEKMEQLTKVMNQMNDVSQKTGFGIEKVTNELNTYGETVGTLRLMADARDRDNQKIQENTKYRLENLKTVDRQLAQGRLEQNLIRYNVLSNQSEAIASGSLPANVGRFANMYERYENAVKLRTNYMKGIDEAREIYNEYYNLESKAITLDEEHIQTTNKATTSMNELGLAHRKFAQAQIEGMKPLELSEQSLTKYISEQQEIISSTQSYKGGWLSRLGKDAATATKQVEGLGYVLRRIKSLVTLAGSIYVWDFAFGLMDTVTETNKAKSEMESYFQTLKMNTSQQNSFNDALNNTVKHFGRINKFQLGETLGSLGVEFNLSPKELEASADVVSMVMNEYLRAGRTTDEAVLAVKDVMQGEFMRLSRETGIGKEELKALGWSGDNKDIKSLMAALEKAGKSRHWDVFAAKATSLNDVMLITKNRFGELATEIIDVFTPGIIGGFNALTGAFDWLINSLETANGFDAAITETGILITSYLTLSKVLGIVMMKTKEWFTVRAANLLQINAEDAKLNGLARTYGAYLFQVQSSQMIEDAQTASKWANAEATLKKAGAEELLIKFKEQSIAVTMLEVESIDAVIASTGLHNLELEKNIIMESTHCDELTAKKLTLDALNLSEEANISLEEARAIVISNENIAQMSSIKLVAAKKLGLDLETVANYGLITAIYAKVVATDADTAATLAESIANEEATMTTWEFTAALLANPVFVGVTAGILAVVGALQILASVTAQDREEMVAYNKTLEKADDTNNKFAQNVKAFDDDYHRFLDANENYTYNRIYLAQQELGLLDETDKKYHQLYGSASDAVRRLKASKSEIQSMSDTQVYITTKYSKRASNQGWSKKDAKDLGKSLGGWESWEKTSYEDYLQTDDFMIQLETLLAMKLAWVGKRLSTDFWDCVFDFNDDMASIQNAWNGVVRWVQGGLDEINNFSIDAQGWLDGINPTLQQWYLDTSNWFETKTQGIVDWWNSWSWDDLLPKVSLNPLDYIEFNYDPNSANPFVKMIIDWWNNWSWDDVLPSMVSAADGTNNEGMTSEDWIRLLGFDIPSFEEIKTTITTKLQDLVSTIKWWLNPVNWFSSDSEDNGGGITTWWNTKVADPLNWLTSKLGVDLHIGGKQAGKKLKTGLSQGSNNASDPVSLEMQDIVTIIGNQKDTFFSKAKEVAGQIIEGIKKGLNRHSPGDAAKMALQEMDDMAMFIVGSSVNLYNSARVAGQSIVQGMNDANLSNMQNGQVVAFGLNKSTLDNTTTTYTQLDGMVNNAFGDIGTTINSTGISVADNLTTMSDTAKTSFTDMASGANQVALSNDEYLNAMSDSTLGTTIKMASAWNSMSNTIINAATRIRTQTYARFSSLHRTIASFYNHLATAKFSAGLSAGVMDAIPRRVKVGRTWGNTGGRIKSPRRSPTMTAGGLEDISDRHTKKIMDVAYPWDVADPWFLGIQIPMHNKVIDFANGTADTKVNYSNFEGILGKILTARGFNDPSTYEFYYNSRKSNQQVWDSKGCNCYDGAEMILEIASMLGLKGSLVNGHWGGIGHSAALIGGKIYDMTQFQKHSVFRGTKGVVFGTNSGTKRYTSGSGRVTNESQTVVENKTVVNVDLSNARIYGIDDLDEHIDKAIRKSVVKLHSRNPATGI